VTTHFVPEQELAALLGERREGRVFISRLSELSPAKGEPLSWLDSAEAGGPVPLEALRRPRSAQSPKGFFLPAAESVGRYGAAASTSEAEGQSATATQTEPLLLVGARACALRARAYLDKVLMEGDFADDAYRERREATTVVSCDCVECAETCFCTLVGGKPFATDGYDVNLTPLADGWLVDVATDKGRALIGQAGLQEATAEHLAERDRLRQQMTDRLRKQNEEFTFAADDRTQPALPEGDDPGWQQFAADCVECGACTNICPTCHCFYLYDHALAAGAADAFERIRTWDSCLLSTYHRMAGGANMKLTPRASLSSRLANRVLHKFTYSPEQYGVLGCVGCGRCVEGCLGAIDIREVVQALGAPQAEEAK
jgi:ferredoxin